MIRNKPNRPPTREEEGRKVDDFMLFSMKWSMRIYLIVVIFILIASNR